MNLANALSVWDWPTACGLLIVGLITGARLVPLTWPGIRLSGAGYPIALAGVLALATGMAFFVFLLVFRVLTHIPNAERTITTGLQWVTFSGTLTVGLALRDRSEGR